MIQRSRVTKPIHKEIVTNPKPNKKVKLLNEFVGGNKLTNKLVNENNIVINMPVPVVKKKRKKKPKISDEAKKNFQQTLSEFRNGNFIEPLDLPDISTIKTSDDLNNFTNMLRLTMGKAPLPIKGKPSLSIMDGEAKPLAPPPSRGSSSMDMPPPAIQPSSYTGTIGNAFTNIVPTNATQTQLSPPPAAAPSAPALPAPAPAPSSAPTQSENLFYKVLFQNIEPIVNKKNSDEPYFVEFNKAFKSYNKDSALYNSIFITNQPSAKNALLKYVDENYNNNDTKTKITILQEYLRTYMELKFWWFKQSQTGEASKVDLTNEQIIQPFLEIEDKTQEELEILVTRPIEEILQEYENIYTNPDTFYTTFYKNGVYTEIQNRPSKIELQNIIRIVNPSYPLGQKTKKEGSSTKTELNKPELAIIFKDEYTKSKTEVSDTNTDTDTDKKELNDFYKKYFPGGTFNSNESDLPRQKLMDMTDLVNSYNNSTTTTYNRLSYPKLVKRFQKDYLAWIKKEPICVISERHADTEVCYPASIYTDYLNQLITNNKIIELDLIYEKATSITPSPTLDNEIKIQEIIASSYRPDKANVIDNDFYVWLQEQTPPNPPINPNPPPPPIPTPTPNTDDSTNLDSTDQNPDLSTNPNKKVISEEDKAILERYKNDYSIENTEELQNLYMKYYGTFYNPRFGRDYPPLMAWKNIQSDLIFSLLHNGKEDISFYNDYQNEITNADFTIQDNEALIDKYYKAFLIFVRDNNISIGEIDNIDTPQEKLDILIEYMFFYQYSTTKTEPTEKVVSPLLLKYYKYLNFLSTNSDDVALRAEYETATHDRFDYVGRPNSFLIEKIKKSNYIPTIEESPLFFTWLETNNGAEDTFTEEQTPKSQTNENQVNLAYKITNVSYDDEDKPRRIDQLMLLNNYTSRNVSVYQDGTTIYFCSTGSRVELSSQAAQDWLQSNIAILMGITTANLSGRFVEEKRILDELVSTLRPTIIIFCGHSLGARLSNELFTYSIESKRNVYQPFSITFNAGSVIHTSFTDKYNNEYLQHRVLQFHANYDPLSATNTIGTVVNVPFTGSYPHSMTNFENVDYSLYKNFVSEGLTFTETINPSYVVPEPIVAPKLEKETKLMELIRKMYELEPDKRYNNKTDQYIKAGTYYDENREYFSTADIEPFFKKYTINDQEFNFFMRIFLTFKRNPTVIDASQAELRPRPVVEVDPTSNDDKNLKLMNYFNELWEMNRDDDYEKTETFTKTLAYYERNKAYFTPLDRNAEKQPMIFNYLVHHETIRPIENFNRYPFFMSLFDRFSGDRRSIEPETNEKEQKLLNLLGQLFELDVNERYNQETEQYINAAIYFNDNKEYFNSIDKETFIEKNTTPGEQFNFYMQMIMDFNRRPRPTITEPIFKEDKPGTIYIPSTF